MKIDIILNIIYKLLAVTIRLICRINGGLEIIGKENIPPKGGLLVAANHISYMDPPLVGAVLPRNATFMARKGLFDIPLLGWMIRGAAFPVDRERPRHSTIKESVRRLKDGALIVIFPEGRRSDTGEIMEAKRGIGLIASFSKVPVVPALIIGSDRALPVDAKWLKRAKIRVVFGKPIYYTSETGENGDRKRKVHEEISNKVMDAIKEMQKKYT